MERGGDPFVIEYNNNKNKNSHSGSILVLKSPYSTEMSRKTPSVGVKAGKTVVTMKLSTSSGRNPDPATRRPSTKMPKRIGPAGLFATDRLSSAAGATQRHP